jgi:hypothetical protein
MFARTLIGCRAQDITLGAHRVRVSISLTDGGSGMYRPGVTFFLNGPNGSVNGIGPKPFPLIKRNSFKLTLPHLTWARGYQLRRFGGLKLHRAIARLYGSALS